MAIGYVKQYVLQQCLQVCLIELVEEQLKRKELAEQENLHKFKTMKLQKLTKEGWIKNSLYITSKKQLQQH